MDLIGEVRMGSHYALGLPGGSRGVDHIGQIVRQCVVRQSFATFCGSFFDRLLGDHQRAPASSSM